MAAIGTRIGVAIAYLAIGQSRTSAM